jgi:hypothetical protein
VNSFRRLEEAGADDGLPGRDADHGDKPPDPKPLGELGVRIDELGR